MTVQSTVKHTGSWAAKDVNKASATAPLTTSQNEFYARIWFDVASHDANPWT